VKGKGKGPIRRNRPGVPVVKDEQGDDHARYIARPARWSAVNQPCPAPDRAPGRSALADAEYRHACAVIARGRAAIDADRASCLMIGRLMASAPILPEEPEGEPILPEVPVLRGEPEVPESPDPV
jgi:hypothetical protein